MEEYKVKNRKGKTESTVLQIKLQASGVKVEEADVYYLDQIVQS